MQWSTNWWHFELVGKAEMAQQVPFSSLCCSLLFIVIWGITDNRNHKCQDGDGTTEEAWCANHLHDNAQRRGFVVVNDRDRTGPWVPKFSMMARTRGGVRRIRPQVRRSLAWFGRTLLAPLRATCSDEAHEQKVQGKKN